MKKNKQKQAESKLTTYEGAITVTAFVILLIYLCYSFISPMPIYVDCTAELQYTNLTKGTCWLEGTVKEYCPLPTKVNCKIQTRLNRNLQEQLIQ